GLVTPNSSNGTSAVKGSGKPDVTTLVLSIVAREVPSVAEQRRSSAPPPAIDPAPLPLRDPAPSAVPTRQAKTKAATTVLLSGLVSSTDPALFLMADGTGGVGMYVPFPPLSSGRRVYGVESPYVRDPGSMGDCLVEDLATAFVAAIRKIQPAGPYLLGGYAAGAVYAWEVSRQLLQAGETVLGLLLIDMPAPAPVSAALSGTILTPEQIEEAGLMGPASVGAGKNIREVRSLQKQHLAAALQMLLRYVPQPLPPGKRPARSTVFVAQHGLGKGRGLVKNPITEWIDANRNRSPTMGWESLVGAVERRELETDHFALLKYPQVCHSKC
ncbi:Polyketide synthase, partial [Rasamsonia emersonii CBS 393.64]